MSASFRLNQPTELTIKLLIQSNEVGTTITVQQQPSTGLCMKPQHHHQQQHPQQLRALPPTPQKAADKNIIGDLLRDFNSLSMNKDPVEQAVAFPANMESLSHLEPPIHLSRSKRLERAHQRARPAAIPIVPDIDTISKQSEALVFKGPEGGRPLVVGSGMIKLQRGQPEDFEQCKIEGEEELLRELLESDDDPLRRKRQLSSIMPESPFPSSMESFSPPGSYTSAPTPPFPSGSSVSGPPSVAEPSPPPPSSQPVKRGRGRPRKPRPEGALSPASTATARTMASGTARGPQLQPRPATSAAGASGSSNFSVSSFVSAPELAEATRVINRYSDSELTTANERGEMLSYTFAKEGNWAKFVALNIRLLSSASLGHIFAGINSTNSLGQTALIEAVVQQNVKGVEYCCLFTCSSDVNLFRALTESALLSDQAIFSKILEKMCIEMDENGNPIRRTNRFIDKPISGWSFRNIRLNQYAGLTLAQMLTLSPPEFHPRLSMLISGGANPRRQIAPEAPENFRAYMDCLHLAAAYSKAPFECLQIFGLKPDDKMPLSWDTTGQTLEWCISAICKRTELDWTYRKSMCERLNRMVPFNLQDLEDLEDFRGLFEC